MDLSWLFKAIFAFDYIGLVGDLYGMFLLAHAWVFLPTIFSIDLVFWLTVHLIPDSCSNILFHSWLFLIWGVVLCIQLPFWQWLLLELPPLLSTNVLFVVGASRGLVMKACFGKSRSADFTSRRIMAGITRVSAGQGSHTSVHGLSTLLHLASLKSCWQILRDLHPAFPGLSLVVEILFGIFGFVKECLLNRAPWKTLPKPVHPEAAETDECEEHGVCGICLEKLCKVPDQADDGQEVKKEAVGLLQRWGCGGAVPESETGEVAILLCGHRFCVPCMVQASNIRRTCPLCRADLHTGNPPQISESVSELEVLLFILGGLVMIFYLARCEANPTSLWSPWLASKLGSRWVCLLLVLPAFVSLGSTAAVFVVHD